MKKEHIFLKLFALKAIFFGSVLLLNQYASVAQEFHGGVTPPRYTGGNKALKEIIHQHLNYPDSLKGTTQGTITDSNGKYKFEIPGEKNELEFSSVGFASRTENVGKNRTINVESDRTYCTLNLDSED